LKNKTVYIIRHAEKANEETYYHKLSCISDKGRKRSESLQNIFGKRFLIPEALFACQYFDPFNCGTSFPITKRFWETNDIYNNGGKYRTEQTLIPLSQKYNLPINKLSFFGGNKGAAEKITDTLQTKNVVLVCWEHFNIYYLTKHLRVPQSMIRRWKSTDYSSVYEIQYGENITFNIHSESY